MKKLFSFIFDKHGDFMIAPHAADDLLLHFFFLTVAVGHRLNDGSCVMFNLTDDPCYGVMLNIFRPHDNEPLQFVLPPKGRDLYVSLRLKDGGRRYCLRRDRHGNLVIYG